MYSFRELRRSRRLTVLDVARLSGIPARLLAEAECGLRELSCEERSRLAFVFGMAEEQVLAAPMVNNVVPFVGAQALAAATLASALLASTLRMDNLPRLNFSGRYGYAASPPAIERVISRRVVDLPRAEPTDQPTGQPTMIGAAAADSALTARPLSPLMLPLSLTEEQPLPDAIYFESGGQLVDEPAAGVERPVPLATRPFPESEQQGQTIQKEERISRRIHEIVVAPGGFAMSEAGPVGCPVLPLRGRVVMTQGYGVGSHAPAEIWGAVDLAVDANGDGWAEPSSSRSVPIVATHDGVAYTSYDSWPGGNYVTVVDHGNGWRTGYAHLERILVESGQRVTAGTIIGLMGDTGMTTGPHLDYQVWLGGRNVDPTALVGVCR